MVNTKINKPVFTFKKCTISLVWQINSEEEGRREKNQEKEEIPSCQGEKRRARHYRQGQELKPQNKKKLSVWYAGRGLIWLEWTLPNWQAPRSLGYSLQKNKEHHRFLGGLAERWVLEKSPWQQCTGVYVCVRFLKGHSKKIFQMKSLLLEQAFPKKRQMLFFCFMYKPEERKINLLERKKKSYRYYINSRQKLGLSLYHHLARPINKYQ